MSPRVDAYNFIYVVDTYTRFDTATLYSFSRTGQPRWTYSSQNRLSNVAVNEYGVVFVAELQFGPDSQYHTLALLAFDPDGMRLPQV